MKKNIEDIYPLSPMQQGMLFHTLYAPAAQVYITQIGCMIEGELHIPEFERAWQQVVERHPILRTGFVWERRDEPLQVVFRDVHLDWSYEDWQSLSEPEQEQQLAAFMQTNQTHGFELSRPPLMRPTLIRLTHEKYYLILCHHHLLMDGWSLPLMLSEVFTYYAAFCQHEQIELPQRRPYGDYIAWLRKQDLVQAETFWRQYLKGFSAPTPFGLVPTPQTADVEEEEVYHDAGISLPAEIAEGLQAIARDTTLTMSVLIQAAWALLLHQYSGEDDIVFGLATSGRPANLAGVDTMIGLFVNTLPERIRVSPDLPLIGWLREIQDNMRAILEYEYSPLVQVQGWSEVPRGTALFESLLIFDNYPVNDFVQERAGDLRIHFLQSVEHTNYPLTLRTRPGAEIYLNLSYAASRFSVQVIERTLTHLLTLLTAFIAQPTRRVRDFTVLSASERDQLLVGWNATRVPYHSEQSLAALLEEQAASTPQEIAVAFKEESLTYQELNARANQLARYLQRQGVQIGTLVGIHMERSLDMLLAILGVLKAGGAYIPLDPSYPAERLEFIQQDAQISLLITEQSLATSPLVQHSQHIFLDTCWPSLQTLPEHNLRLLLSSQLLAYVIYTSGSTGKPKGVQIPQSAVVNLLASMQKRLHLDTQDTFLAVTSLSFDIAALELFLPLLTGARLVIADQETTFNGEKLIESLAACSATVMQATPAAWRMLVAAGWEGQDNLKLLCGGEALPPALAAELTTLAPFVLNVYGPTETTIWSTSHILTATPTAPIPIGRPLDNTQIYILNCDLQPVPMGARGDLYIAGKGLAYGYLHRPDLTAERFIPHPFASEPGERLYKTGDVARYQPDGTIEFLGRSDHQVKLHGFRIELGEIEQALTSCAQVAQAVVALREDIPGDQRLVGYVKPVARDVSPSVNELRDHLKATLPAYMIPAAFVFIDEVPLTPNGKINYHALPALDMARPDLREEFISARTPEEQSLTQIWQRILRLEQIGVNDNFFDLGGHSLLMIQLYTRIREQFKRDFMLVDMFKYPTIASLAAFLSSEDEMRQEEIASTAKKADDRAQFRAQSMQRQRQLRERQRALKK